MKSKLSTNSYFQKKLPKETQTKKSEESIPKTPNKKPSQQEHKTKYKGKSKWIKAQKYNIKNRLLPFQQQAH